MATEQYVNDVTTTLNGDVDGSTTTVVVADATGFPSAGNFRIRIDSEIMKVTARAGTSLTVTRASESTTGASHLSGATVSIVHTAAAIDAIISETITRTTFAARLAAAKNGRANFNDDGMHLHLDSSAAWFSFGPIWLMTPIVQADFSWVNQGGATETARGAAVTLQNEAGRTNQNVAVRVKTAPATPWTVTAAFLVTSNFGNTVNGFAGLCLRESATGKFMSFDAFQQDLSNGQRFVSFAQSAGPTGGFTTVTNTNGAVSFPIWMRLTNDGTNLVWSYSGDGFTWVQLSTELKTAHFTTAPDQVGYCCNIERWAITMLSWAES